MKEKAKVTITRCVREVAIVMIDRNGDIELLDVLDELEYDNLEIYNVHEILETIE